MREGGSEAEEEEEKLGLIYQYVTIVCFPFLQVRQPTPNRSTSTLFFMRSDLYVKQYIKVRSFEEIELRSNRENRLTNTLGTATVN